MFDLDQKIRAAIQDSKPCSFVATSTEDIFFGPDAKFAEDTEVTINVTFPGILGEDDVSVIILCDPSLCHPNEGYLSIEVGDDVIATMTRVLTIDTNEGEILFENS